MYLYHLSEFYDRIGLYLPKGRNDRPGMKEIWQRAADKENAALGEYIKIAVNEKISRTDAELAAMLFAAEADESPALRALRQPGEEAKKNGTANMTLEEINAEIDFVAFSTIFPLNT